MSKWLLRALRAIGFSFQYIAPVILFGDIIPYTHGDKAAGLTKAGYFAAALILVFILRKIKDRIKMMPKSALRAALLSIAPIVLWAIVFVGIGYVQTAMASLTAYWNRIIIFIVLGRLFYILEEALSSAEWSEHESK